MSFLNPFSLPVKRYFSDDSGAPQWAYDDMTGNLKTILKACLITGYGDKTGLGWAMEEIDEHQAIFRSQDARSPKVGLLVDSSKKNSNRVDVVFDGDGSAKAFNISSSFTEINGTYLKSSRAKWALFGTDLGFVLLITGTYQNKLVATPLYFGAAQQNVKNPQGLDFVLMAHFINIWYVGSGIINALRAINGRSCFGFEVSSSPNLHLLSIAALSYQNKNQAVSSRVYGQVFLVKDNYIVGALPGVLVGSHALGSDKNEQVKIDGSSEDWFLGCLSSYQYSDHIPMLINMDSWVY